MKSTQYNLMALAPLDNPGWLSIIEQILDEAGYKTLRGSGQILVSGDQNRRDSLLWSDGWCLKRLWLGPRESALSILPRRLYFNQEGEFDTRAEHQIVLTTRPQSAKKAIQVEKQWELLQLIISTFPETNLHPVNADLLSINLLEFKTVCIGKNRINRNESLINHSYRTIGFDSVPANMRITVCPVEGVADEIADKFISLIRKSSSKRKMPVNLGKSCANKINQRLSHVKSKKMNPLPGHCILFVLPSNTIKPDKSTLNLMDALEKAGVPFRRAYANDPHRFSIPDQIPSLLMAAGGRPHRSPIEISGEKLWTIGIDLGHDRDSRESTLALSLVDPDGSLVRAWTKKQKLNETVNNRNLILLLERCKEWLFSIQSNPSIIVLRDGRLFENESFSTYENILGHNISLFEYRKGGNPQIVYNVSSVKYVDHPVAVGISGCETIFVVTGPSRDRNSLPFVAKIAWKKSWNGLGISKEQLAAIIVLSSTAPGLGAFPHNFPSAIYWADGVAKTNETDLRFRGQPVVRLT